MNILAPYGHLDFDIMLRLFKRKYKGFLFPNTPIQIAYEFDYQFHFYCEGQWDSPEESELGLELRLYELLAIHRDLWPEIRMNPDWDGWGEISQVSLYEALHGV